MGFFGLGLLIGWVSGLVVFILLSRAQTRRIVRLQKQASQSERLAELGTLTAGLAHELKNPLSTVGLNLQLLREDIDPKDPAYERIISRMNTIQRETSRLKDILDDFLRYGGKMELDKRPTDLNELLGELVDFYNPQAQLSRIQLRLKKGEGEVVAPVDARLMKQAVLNLMINATHAMQDRGGGDLILSAGRQDGEATIDVIDTGAGMAPEVAGKIFQAYYSTKKGGTGLGLPMARRIVEEHGGKMTLRTEVGKGTDFSIHLPLN